MIKVLRCNLDMLQHTLRKVEEDGHTIISVAGFTDYVPNPDTLRQGTWVRGMAIVYREVDHD